MPASSYITSVELGKITKPSRRGYDDACGTAHGLELIGDRWALLVLRELMLGARRFSDLKGDLPGISGNVLTQRLTEMEASGLVRRTRLPPPAARDVYEATPWGLEAEPVIQALGRWAARSPGHDASLPLSPVSILLSFRTMIDERKARGVDLRIGLRMHGQDFVARVRKGRIKVSRGTAQGCEAVISVTPERLAGAVYGGAPFEELAVEGDEAAARRFLGLFVLPPKAGVPAPVGKGAG
jgi:DNA-binding HxlR family transcriptional regulator